MYKEIILVATFKYLAVVHRSFYRVEVNVKKNRRMIYEKNGHITSMSEQEKHCKYQD